MKILLLTIVASLFNVSANASQNNDALEKELTQVAKQAQSTLNLLGNDDQRIPAEIVNTNSRDAKETIVAEAIDTKTEAKNTKTKK